MPKPSPKDPLLEKKKENNGGVFSFHFSINTYNMIRHHSQSAELIPAPPFAAGSGTQSGYQRLLQRHQHEAAQQPQPLPPPTRDGGRQPGLAGKARQLEIRAQRAFQRLTASPAAAGAAPPCPRIAIICFRQTAVIGSIHFKSVIVCASSSQGKSSL